jgi:hypothetical protein
MARAICLGAFVASASCDSDDGSQAALWSSSEEDASVLTFAGTLADAFEIASSAVVTIGDASGPEWTTFGRIGSGEILADGGFAIADMQAYKIHVYGVDGSHRHSIGRPGNGPGEFASINGLAEVADRLEVWDSRGQRLTSFDSVGAIVGTIAAPGGPYLTLMERWEGAEGYFALSLSQDDRRPPEGSDFALTVVHADVSRVTGSVGARLFRIPYLQAGQAVRDGNPIMVTLPFPHRGRTAVFAGGVAVVYSGEPEVAQYDIDGGLLRRIRFPAFDVPLEEAVVESAREAALAGASTPEHRQIVETGFSLALPERMPTFDEVRTDGEDLVLGLHRAWAADGLRPWLFVSPTRRRAGVLRLADGARILDVEGDRVLVAGVTAAGVPQVTLLEIEAWK